MIFSRALGRLYMSVLEVGSGEAVLVQSPTDRYLLVNGVPSPSRFSDALGRRLPLTHRRLDYLVVASPSAQGIAALPSTIQRYPPENVLWVGPTIGTRAARNLQAALHAPSIRPVMAETGQTLHLGDGAQMRVIAVGERGAVLLLSVTPDDRGGLPSPGTLEAVEGYNLLRTDQNGWIELITDGEQMWVEVERKKYWWIILFFTKGIFPPNTLRTCTPALFYGVTLRSWLYLPRVTPVMCC